MHLVNLAARFGLELVGVGAVGLLAASPMTGPAARVAAGAIAAIAFALIWSLVVAPKADNPIPQEIRLLIGSGLLLLVAGGLSFAGQRDPAAVFALAIVLNTLLLFVLPQGMPAGLATGAVHQR